MFLLVESITLRRPDDWHVHLRDNETLAHVARFTARQFARAIVMPNLSPPVVRVRDAIAYRERILAAVPSGLDFRPLMTCYLTDAADPSEIAAGYADDVFAACKIYPAHATTNSAAGVTDILKLSPVLGKMEEIGMPLLIHGEVTDREVDIFDRESLFIDRVLSPLMLRHPNLKIVFEHITTAEAVDFVSEGGPKIAATITPQHLILNRNAMFDGGIRPHAYCLPVVKREKHRLALRAAATSGLPGFFLGTDSAPHSALRKESACGCAGIFNAPFALESYLQVFEEENALQHFAGFASEHGPQFYGLPLNTGTITLERRAVEIPQSLSMGSENFVPFLAGQTMNWSLQEPAVQQN